MLLFCCQPGKLLPSAHAVEREYRVMEAAATQSVPVPTLLSLCEDSRLEPCGYVVCEFVCVLIG